MRCEKRKNRTTKRNVTRADGSEKSSCLLEYVKDTVTPHFLSVFQNEEMAKD